MATPIIWGALGPIRNGIVKLPTTPINVKVSTINSGTTFIGNTMRHNTVRNPAPTSWADSINSCSIPSRPEPSISTAKAKHQHGEWDVEPDLGDHHARSFVGG